MARIRSIKPEFWTDGTMVGLSMAARLFYVGTWNFALCDRGHLPDDPLGLKLKILPADDVDANAIVRELLKAGRLVRRTSSTGRTYLLIPRLVDHQKVDARWQSRCPHCASEESGQYTEDSPSLPETPVSPAEPPRTSPQDRKGRDGIGEEGIGKETPRAARASATAAPAVSFDDFWSLYPRKEAKDAARRAWGKAIKRADPSVIVAGAHRYRDDPNRDPQYTAHPATWLNNGRWADEPLPARAKARASPERLEVNGLHLDPLTAQRMTVDRARFQALDAAEEQRLAIEGPA